MAWPTPRARFIASTLLAAVGLWLFFGDGIDVRGVSLGFVGVWLVVAAAWLMVDAAHRNARTEAELAVSPGEWQAWIGAVFLAVLLAQMALHADAFAGHVPIQDSPAANIAGRRLATVFVAWLVLLHVLKRRWEGRVLSDERDRRIAEVSASWGRSAIIAVVVGMAVMLGFSPTARLQQISYPMLAQMLMAALVLGAWFDHAVAAILYWRDRRAAA